MVIAAVMLWPEKVAPKPAAAQAGTTSAGEVGERQDLPETEESTPPQMVVAVEQIINGERFAGAGVSGPQWAGARGDGGQEHEY